MLNNMVADATVKHGGSSYRGSFFGVGQNVTCVSGGNVQSIKSEVFDKLRDHGFTTGEALDTIEKLVIFH